MTALEYMEKCVQKHRINYNREVLRGAPEEVLQNIREKLGHYEAAVEALKHAVEEGEWGKWTYAPTDGVIYQRPCSVCGHLNIDSKRYCTYCGARMKG